MRSASLVCLALLGASLGAGVAAGGRDGSLILFWSDRTHPALWAMRPDGTGQRLLYRTVQNAKRPTLSPDGTLVAFDGAPPGKEPMSDFDIQVMRVDGSGRRTLAGSPALETDAQWSPDGVHLSFSRAPPPSDWRRSWTWIVRRDGRKARRLVRGQFARWSPDGARLVLDAPTAESDGDLFVVAVDGSSRVRLTRTAVLEQPAGWSRDGRILFTRYAPDGSGRASIWVIGVDGTGLRRLTNGRHGDIAAAWSPDGARILFTSDRTGHSQVFVMNADGSGQRNLSRNRFADEATSWR
jgi:TolB protein